MRHNEEDEMKVGDLVYNPKAGGTFHVTEAKTVKDTLWVHLKEHYNGTDLGWNEAGCFRVFTAKAIEDLHLCPKCKHEKVNHNGKGGPCFVMDCEPCGMEW